MRKERFVYILDTWLFNSRQVGTNKHTPPKPDGVFLDLATLSDGSRQPVVDVDEETGRIPGPKHEPKDTEKRQ